MKSYINTHVIIGKRHFFAMEKPAGSPLLPGHCGPWLIIENNGDGKPPVVHREGISGSRANAVKQLTKYTQKLS